MPCVRNDRYELTHTRTLILHQVLTNFGSFKKDMTNQARSPVRGGGSETRMTSPACLVDEPSLPIIFHAALPDNNVAIHDDVIKWKHFPRYWPFVRGIHRSPVNSPHKGQWRGALVLSLICVWINGWVNNRDAGDLSRYRAHYDVIVMRQTVIQVPIAKWHHNDVIFPNNIGTTLKFDCKPFTLSWRNLENVIKIIFLTPVGRTCCRFSCIGVFDM